jgi:hypothetical protein
MSGSLGDEISSDSKSSPADYLLMIDKLNCKKS